MRRLHVPLALLIASALLAGCGMFRGGDDPIEPPAELVDFSATLQVDRLWSTRLGRGGDQLRLGLHPATNGTTVFAASHAGRVTAVDFDDGRRRWQTRLDEGLSAGPGYGDGLLAVGSVDGYLTLLDADTGERRWTRFVGGELLAPPAVSSQAIVVRTVDGRLAALSVEDGRQLWLNEQAVPALTLRGNAPPVINSGYVVAAFDNGRLGVYSMGNGEPLWEQQLAAPAGRSELERLVDINTRPVVIGSSVYAVGYQGRLVALDLETGEVGWSRDFSSYAGLGSDWERLYVVDDEGEILAVSRRTGNSVWLNDRMRMRDLTAPQRVGESVVVGDLDGYVHWLSSSDGEFQARTRTGSDRVLGILPVGDAIVVQTADGRLDAYRPRGRD